MSLSLQFNDPFFAGASTSTEVPGRFHCSLGGRPYMIDTSRLEEFRRQGIPMLKDQQDAGATPGEASLSNEELWRRSQDDWSHGAGQTFLDRQNSDPQRFRSSKGVDVWTKWQLSLLHDTVSKRVSANTSLLAVPAGDLLYLVDGPALVRTADLTAYTTITAVPATAASSIATDGYTVWTAHGADGVYTVNPTGTAAASYATGTVDLVGYVKGRLMAAAGPSLYNITASGALPAALFTSANTDFTWVGFAAGQTAAYAAGFSGDKSLVYRLPLKSDGTGLDVPIVAGELPDGEIVRAVYGYLGFICLGTDKGVRFCATGSSGELTIGALIRTDSPVTCFEGQDRFVWFGWTNYDADSTGLGRMDLSTFTSSLTPAYASDLMVTGQGAVTSVATFAGQRVLTVAGLGLYVESSDPVAQGTLDTGLITFGLPDRKTALYLDVKVQAITGTNAAYVSVDRGAFVNVGLRAGTLLAPFVVGELSGEVFEVRHELNNATYADPVGPVLSRWTLRALPRPSQGELFLAPLLLHEQVVTVGDGTYTMDPAAEFEALVALRESKQLVTWQLGDVSRTVVVDDALFQYETPTSDMRAWNGTALVRLKAFAD